MRTTKLISCSLPMDLYELLERACRETKIGKSTYIQMALRLMFQDGQATIRLPDYEEESHRVSKKGEQRKKANRR